MANNENNSIDLQRHSAIQDARISNLETKFEMFMQEMKDFKTEMRDRDNQRHSENQNINAKIENIGNHVRNVSIAAFVGIGAMVITSVIAIAAMVWSSIPK